MEQVSETSNTLRPSLVVPARWTGQQLMIFLLVGVVLRNLFLPTVRTFRKTLTPNTEWIYYTFKQEFFQDDGANIRMESIEFLSGECRK